MDFQGRTKRLGVLACGALLATVGWIGCVETDWSASLDETLAIERSGDLDEAGRRYGEAVGTLAERRDGGGELLIRALTGQARVKLAQGDIDGALPVFDRALELQVEQLEPGSPELMVAYHRVASAYQSAGRTARARELLEKALAAGEAAHGEEALELCETLNSLGLLDLFEGRLDDAERVFRRSLAIMQSRLLAGHPNLLPIHGNLGEVLRRRGDVAGATEHYREAIEIARMNALPARAASARSNLAGMLREAGRHDEAEAEYLEAIAELQPVAARYPIELASALSNLGLTYVRLGRFGEAETYYTQAIDVLEPLGETPDLASGLFNLARLYERQRRYEEAAAPCERSAAMFETVEGPRSASLATVLEGCASVLRALERNAEADAALDRARTIRSAS